MRKQALVEKVKHVAYLVVLPIYLWSVGFKTLEEYIQAILIEEDGLGNKKTVDKALTDIIEKVVKPLYNKK